MEGKPITYNNFTVYPEYCELSYEELKRLSSKNDRFHIATLPILGYNMGVVFHKGKKVITRPKYRLHPSEDVTPGRSQPVILRLGNSRVLVLICYEILFPRDYLPIGENPNLIVHLVGAPMFDEAQREGWVAMQKTLSITLRCPLVCCCGGETGIMNITGVTLPR